jgi:hypothetical protein
MGKLNYDQSFVGILSRRWLEVAVIVAAVIRPPSGTVLPRRPVVVLTESSWPLVTCRTGGEDVCHSGNNSVIFN